MIQTNNTIKDALEQAYKTLKSHSDSASIDAQILLGHCLDCTRTYLYTWPDKLITPQQSECFNNLLKQRLQGEPVAYITGEKAFWNMDLKVSAATLIPRPETELLVETALSLISPNKAASILELGTGSAAIALALAHEHPDCQITAVELSPEACAIAQQNIQNYSKGNVQLLAGHWFTPVEHQRFDLIISNPPYVADNDPHLLQGDVRYEPSMALSAGTDGLDEIRHIISEAQHFLNDSGWLLLEHGYNQANAVEELFLLHNYISIKQYKDHAGHFRVSVAQVNGNKKLET
jgi:release factor glutamine methyltransferase